MKRAVIDYDRKDFEEGSKGRVIINGAEPGDPLVAEVLDDLAKTGAENVRLEFEEDFL